MLTEITFFSGSYELVRMKLTREGESVADLPAHKIFFSSGVAGILYWLLSYPTDVVKSAMQSDEADKSKRVYRNIPHCAKKLYLEEGGWRRFYRGLLPCLMRSVPANGTMMLVMETCRKFLLWCTGIHIPWLFADRCFLPK